MHEHFFENTQPQETDTAIDNEIIELSKPSELLSLEDEIASAIKPNMNDRQVADWNCRANLIELIRPPKFNGRIANIRLEPMDDPLARLMDANERGLKFVKGFVLSPLSHDEDLLDSLTKQYKGFYLTADAKSSGRGVVDQIITEIWYGPTTPRKPGSSYSVEQRAANSNGGIRRYIARPETEQKKFEKHHRNAVISIGSAAVFGSSVALNRQSSKRFDSPKPTSNTN